METRNIFIDTSIFIAQNYSYSGSVFDNLARLAKAKQANIFLSDITIREIEAHIEEDINKAVNASAKFKKDARVLRNISSSPYAEFFQEIDVGSVLDNLKRQLEDFIQDIDAETLSTSEVPIGEVFDKYFDRKPPFGDGKKKAEFPDAFVVQALETWCEDNNEVMYAASTDPDFNSYCKYSEKLIGIDKLAEFISLVEFHDEVLAPAIRDLVDNNTSTIEDAISDSFLDQDFWIDDQDGDVNEVRVKSMEVTDMLLLEVGQNAAIVQLGVSAKFEADLTYDDLATASYDSEDKVLLPWRKIDETVDREEDFTATLHLLHDVEEPDYFEIDSVEINTYRNFGFSVTSGEGQWPYK